MSESLRGGFLCLRDYVRVKDILAAAETNPLKEKNAMPSGAYAPGLLHAVCQLLLAREQKKRAIWDENGLTSTRQSL